VEEWLTFGRAAFGNRLAVEVNPYVRVYGNRSDEAFTA